MNIFGAAMAFDGVESRGVCVQVRYDLDNSK